MNITRDEAFEILKKYIKNEKLIFHSLASEAVLQALARQLNCNEQQWGLAGLLHDIDAEITKDNPELHALEAVNILKPYNIDEIIIDAIKMHNEQATKLQRSTMFQHALAAGETITGLIFATTLVYPDKKIANVKVKSVVKRMKESSFAASVNRDTIRECEKLGLSLEAFVEISLTAMQNISNNIGL